MRKILTLSLLLCGLSLSQAQTQIGFRMPEKANRVDVPFEEINNLIVIPIIVNDFLKLKFILDTGVETTILTEPAFAPLLSVEFFRKIVISGVGINDSINAFVAKEVGFELPGGVIGKNMNMLVLEDDFLKLSERMGTDVHGIIGYDIFKQFVVEFDYNSQIVRLHKPGTFKPKKRMSEKFLDLDGSKPYVFVKVNESSDSLRLMVDSGASHALLLDPDQTNITIPKKTIKTRLGTGLGGEITGKIGRFQQVEIASFQFDDVLVSIPNRDAYSRLIKRGSRQGTMGSEILSRLNPVFDYGGNRIFFSKSKNYKRGFEAEMAGMDLVVKGRFLDSLYVDYIRKDSPADLADIRVGDVVLTLNARSLGAFNLGQFQSILKTRPKKMIRVRLLRNNERLKKEFRLKRQI